MVDVRCVEHFLQFQCGHDQGIAVIALSGIDHSGDPVDIAEIQLVVTVFCTSGGKDHSVFRKFLGKFRVVLSGIVTAVAACHHHELLDLSGFDSLTQLVKDLKDLIHSEPGGNRTGLQLRRRCALLCLLDDGGKVFGLTVSSVNMLYAGIMYHSGGIKTVLIGIFGWNEAVGGQQDRSVKAFKLLGLLMPCTTVICHQIRIFFQFRIAVGCQHLSMGIDIHSGSLCLFQKHLQITKIMAGNQDSGVLSHPDIHFRCHRISIGFGIGFIQRGHGQHAIVSDFQGTGDQLSAADLIIIEHGQHAFHEFRKAFIPGTQHVGMIGISSQPLQSVHDQFSGAALILILFGKDTDLRCLGFIFRRICRLPRYGFRKKQTYLNVLQHLIAHVHSKRNAIPQIIGIETDIRHRQKQVLRHQTVCLTGCFLSFRSALA